MRAPLARPLLRRPQDDYRFGLLWEWNLYDAMLNSPYVAARLQTYTGASTQSVHTRLPAPRQQWTSVSVLLDGWATCMAAKGACPP